MHAQGVREFLQRYVAAAAEDIDATLERYVADEGLKEHAHFFQSSFPGYRIEPLETIAEGNKIAVYAMFHGTHGGPLLGIEVTGKEVSFPFMIMYIIEEEKVVGHYIVLNELELLRQLDVQPSATLA